MKRYRIFFNSFFIVLVVVGMMSCKTQDDPVETDGIKIVSMDLQMERKVDPYFGDVSGRLRVTAIVSVKTFTNTRVCGEFGCPDREMRNDVEPISDTNENWVNVTLGTDPNVHGIIIPAPGTYTFSARFFLENTGTSVTSEITQVTLN